MITIPILLMANPGFWREVSKRNIGLELSHIFSVLIDKVSEIK